MIEISERRKLKTFSLLQGCEMVDGLAGVARLAVLWHRLAKPPMVAAMVGRPEDMLTLLLDRLCAVFLTDPPTGTEGLAMCAELMFMAGELTEGLWFE